MTFWKRQQSFWQNREKTSGWVAFVYDEKKEEFHDILTSKFQIYQLNNEVSKFKLTTDK